jgi:P pilus assembly chaperone PapD
MRAMHIPRRLLAGTALALAATAAVPLLLEAILVAPHAVFMDHRSRTGQLFLVNTGTEPEEVTIDLRFGYPTADSTGAVYIRFVDEPGPEHPSATGWIRAFPRRTVVRPGERQVVRLLAQPPAQLDDGEYWSRIIVASRPAAGGAAADSAVRANVTVELRTVISLSYRKGVVRTNAVLSGLDASVAGDSLVVWAQLDRGGNAAFLGTAEVALVDAAGRTAATWTTLMAVYDGHRRRLTFPLEEVRPGTYGVRVRLTTARADLPSANILQAPPVVDSTTVVVP